MASSCGMNHVQRRPRLALPSPRPWLLLLAVVLCQAAAAAAAALLPLPPPIHCSEALGCTVDNHQGMWPDRKPCRAARALYPTTEAELFDAVAWASRTGSPIKVLGKGSHSLPKLVCPAGDHGLLVSTERYNSIINIDRSSLTVTAQAGALLTDLLPAIAAQGLSLPHTPYWRGVSVAGMISTGAHGSSMWHPGSAAHDYVVAVRLIVPSGPEDGHARILDLAEGNDDLDAARLSLGMLGAISTVTFQLQPLFKRSVELRIQDDDSLEDEILEFARRHEFAGLYWYPGTRKVLWKIDDRVGVETPGDGAYKLAMFDKMDVQQIGTLRKLDESLEQTQDGEALCENENMVLAMRFGTGDGLLNDGTTFTGYPVIGFNHNMQTAGGCESDSPQITATGIDANRMVVDQSLESDECAEGILESSLGNKALFTCFWNPLLNNSITVFDVSVSLPTSKAKAFIQDIKRLTDVDSKAMCALSALGGFWIRFQTKSKAYLGVPYDSVVFEFFTLRAKQARKPRVYESHLQEIEQILVRKFGGKPHWGKNRPLAFEDMSSSITGMDKFWEVKSRFDPLSLFSNEWTNSIFKRNSSVQTLDDYCALEGLCICREDRHCYPSKGYFCRPGHVYQDARVCRHESTESIKTI